MVKLQKSLREDAGSSGPGPGYLAVSGYPPCKGYRRKRKQLVRVKVLKKMLTPKRAGPVSPEEIGAATEAKEGNGGGGSGAGTPGSYENGDGSKEFLSTGRTGRRNALPDILGRHAETGISDLPNRFGELSTDASDRSSGGGQDPNTPGTSKQHG